MTTTTIAKELRTSLRRHEAAGTRLVELRRAIRRDCPTTTDAEFSADCDAAWRKLLGPLINANGDC